jgi:two-component system chemotaxis response regulator CheB
MALCGDELLPGIQKAVPGGFGFRRGASAQAITEHSEISSVCLAVVEYLDERPWEFDLLAVFLKNRKIPFIALCRQSASGFKAMKLGAVDSLVVPSPNEKNTAASLNFFSSSLKSLVQGICTGDSERRLKNYFTGSFKKIVAVGASTGGSEAVTYMLKQMPAFSPPIVLALHMPPVFTRMLAEHINHSSAVTVWEAKNGDRLQPGLALIARGDGHIELRKDMNGYYVEIVHGPPIKLVRPSVDVFFNSVAKCAGRDSIGVILTGMGTDGAEGLLNMKRAGAYTIGQDKDSSVVYGMPRAAYELGAVDVQAGLGAIAGKIMENI